MPPAYLKVTLPCYYLDEETGIVNSQTYPSSMTKAELIEEKKKQNMAITRTKLRHRQERKRATYNKKIMAARTARVSS